jgi:hypothetical protein
MGLGFLRDKPKKLLCKREIFSFLEIPILLLNKNFEIHFLKFLFNDKIGIPRGKMSRGEKNLMKKGIQFSCLSPALCK